MPTATRERPKMTAEEAQTFNHYSVQNVASAMRQLEEAGACNGTCEGYSDIFTYQRWQALGFQVQKGQHGAKLAIIIEGEKEDEQGNTKRVSRPWTTTVFCRHQVAPKENGANACQHVSAR